MTDTVPKSNVLTTIRTEKNALVHGFFSILGSHQPEFHHRSSAVLAAFFRSLARGDFVRLELALQGLQW